MFRPTQRHMANFFAVLRNMPPLPMPTIGEEPPTVVGVALGVTARRRHTLWRPARGALSRIDKYEVPVLLDCTAASANARSLARAG
eukprot:949697-Alexandrium_andersonii.AAC.1